MGDKQKPKDIVELGDGKYKLVFDNEKGEFHCFRHGEIWRDLTGDKMVYLLFSEVLESRARAVEKGECPKCKSAYQTMQVCMDCGHVKDEDFARYLFHRKKTYATSPEAVASVEERECKSADWRRKNL